MRTKGAYNKPKFAMVKISDLASILNTHSQIPVKIDFLTNLGMKISYDNVPNPVEVSPIPDAISPRNTNDMDKTEKVTLAFSQII